jgi:hypothetical protein
MASFTSFRGPAMPRYFFHLHNDIEATDEEGMELSDLEAARTEAIRSGRELVAEAVRNGQVNLSHWIEIQDESGTQLLAVRFGDTVRIES